MCVCAGRGCHFRQKEIHRVTNLHLFITLIHWAITITLFLHDVQVLKILTSCWQ